MHQIGENDFSEDATPLKVLLYVHISVHPFSNVSLAFPYLSM
jgi:hypothetical protein